MNLKTVIIDHKSKMRATDADYEDQDFDPDGIPKECPECKGSGENIEGRMCHYCGGSGIDPC